MFLKAALTFLAVGALSVNAFAVPVARSPAPEPESQGLEAQILKRDLSYPLFSREPEDWVQWVGFARDQYTAKREPSPQGNRPPRPQTPPVPVITITPPRP